MSATKTAEYWVLALDATSERYWRDNGDYTVSIVTLAEATRYPTERAAFDGAALVGNARRAQQSHWNAGGSIPVKVAA